MRDAAQWLSEQRGHAGQKPGRVIAVERVETHSGEVDEAHARVIASDLDEFHALHRVEFGVRAHHVPEYEARSAERPQRRLESLAD